MVGHTPGPWEILYAGQEEMDMSEAECIALDMPVASIGPINYCEFPAGSKQNIEREYADARLIASAPDLLEAAKVALQIVDRKTIWCDNLRAAIDKAEGRA